MCSHLILSRGPEGQKASARRKGPIRSELGFQRRPSSSPNLGSRMVQCVGRRTNQGLSGTKRERGCFEQVLIARQWFSGTRAAEAAGNSWLCSRPADTSSGPAQQSGFNKPSRCFQRQSLKIIELNCKSPYHPTEHFALIFFLYSSNNIQITS